MGRFMNSWPSAFLHVQLRTTGPDCISLLKQTLLSLSGLPSKYKKIIANFLNIWKELTNISQNESYLKYGFSLLVGIQIDRYYYIRTHFQLNHLRKGRET